MRQFIEGKTVLVTGGTGSIGSEIVRQLLEYDPKMVRVLSRTEQMQYALMQELGRLSNLVCFIGDVRNPERLNRAAVEAKPFAVTFRFEGDPQTGPVHIDYANVSGSASAAGEPTNEAKILAFLGKQPGGRAQTGAILEGAGVPASSGYDTLKKLEGVGLVAKATHGVWGLTARGVALGA